jgi:hypothetical protein
MPPVNLLTGSYMARSVIANAQRCLNLFPEKNPEDAKAPFTCYPTPGLTKLGVCPNRAPYRGIYSASNGKVYAVVGQRLYYIRDNWSFEQLGVLSSRVRPVSMVDNGIELVIVDGPYGYRVDLTTNVFSSNMGANFLGADKVGYLDTFLLFNQPNTGNFYVSESNSVVFDSLDIARKTAFPDRLVSLAVVHREIWLIGETTSEIWANTGAGDFQFEIVQGAFIEHGCVAKYSVAQHGDYLFWLSKDKDGYALVVAGAGQVARRISTRAIEHAITEYSKIDDSIGLTYQFKGHVCYMLTFPTAQRTWVYDMTEELWHEEAWTDSDGDEYEHRANAMAFGYGRNLVGDRQDGTLFELNPKDYTNNGLPIKRLRSMPTLSNEDKRVSYTRFIASMEVGTILDDSDPQVSLRFSDNYGVSWSDPVLNTLGRIGAHETSLLWTRLGSGRNRVFELSWALPARTALNGAFVEFEASET